MKWLSELFRRLFPRQERIKIKSKGGTQESSTSAASFGSEVSRGCVTFEGGIGTQSLPFTFSLMLGGRGGVLVSAQDGEKFVARHYPAERECWGAVAKNSPKSWQEFEQVIALIESTPLSTASDPPSSKAA